MEEFNQIASTIENEHAHSGTEVDHDGEIVWTWTAWACGFREGET